MSNTKQIELSWGQMNYTESEGAGAPIMLIHGNSGSSKAFDKQVNGSLGAAHRVVAIDLPGHGGSAALAGAGDYSFPAYAKAIVEAATALGMDEAVFVGWSLGGHALLEASAALPKAKGFVIYGTPPLDFPPAMEAAFLPNPAMAAAFNPVLSAEEVSSFVSAFFAPDKAGAHEPFIGDVVRTDPNARAGMGASIAPGGYADETPIVRDMKVPLAVLHGAEEQLVNAGFIIGLEMPSLWRGEVQMVAGAGHAAQWDAPEAFNALIAEFVAEL